MALEKKIYQLELKVLYEISGIIGQILQLDQALDSILEILSQSLSMERATVTLRDMQTGLLKICASHSLRPEEKKRGIYQPSEGVTGLIFRTAQPFFVPDIGKEPLFLNKTQSRDIRKDSVAFIGVPIILHGTPIGVFSVDRLFEPEVSFEEDIRFLTIVATLIAQFVHLNRQIERREMKLKSENRSLRAEISEKYNHFFAVGVSPAMQALNELIRKVAPSKASVLLLGESGTGKTLTARILHELSPRSRRPFAKVNCAALPDNLIEAELFGHEKGAFTGAAEAKKGRFEEADGGTVFLDEIGELPPAVQAKLLSFLQEREFERLGSTRTRRVDVRIIAATNADLPTAAATGRFRPDLYHRLNVFPIAIPPLTLQPVEAAIHPNSTNWLFYLEVDHGVEDLAGMTLGELEALRTSGILTIDDLLSRTVPQLQETTRLKGFLLSVDRLHALRGQALHELGEICDHRGDPQQAVEMWRAAKRCFEEGFPGEVELGRRIRRKTLERNRRIIDAHQP